MYYSFTNSKLYFHYSQLMLCILIHMVNQRIVNKMSVTFMLSGEAMGDLWTLGWKVEMQVQMVGLPWDSLVLAPLWIWCV